MALVFDLPPLIAGRYRVLDLLGRGGIAQVVRARDERMGRDVALKVLYPNLRDTTAVADRFRREVEIVRRIEHPHVIRIHELGDSDGHTYLVMDLHGGGDVADRVAARGRLPPEDILTLARQVCGALDAAHRAGVVHRDIKPQNILVGPGPAIDARLADFGLARTADFAGLTTGTTVLGTPEYMAPEVIAEGHADPRSDIYSLAAVLFEAATGTLPFHGDSPYQILRQHLVAPVPRVRDVVPDAPAALDEALARAMAKEPIDRFASAGDLFEALAAATPATTALAPRTAVPTAVTGTRAVCPRCGGALVAAAGVCVDCGARALRLTHRRHGVAVLVTGPGEVADKIDSHAYVTLVKLLGELPDDAADDGVLRKGAPRLPFFVARDLDDASAENLLEHLRERGFEARIEPKASLALAPVRRRVGRMSLRFLAVGAASTPYAWSGLTRHPGGVLALLGLSLALPFVSAAFAAWRPLVRPRGGGRIADAGGDLLASALPRLTRREDRRLAGRVLERLETARALGHGEAARVLAARAGILADAIAGLERSDLGGDERDLARALTAAEGADALRGAERALDHLREGERRRAALVTELLRVWSRLDGLCLKAARAAALGTREAVDGVRAEADALRVELEAAEDVEALLGGRHPSGRGPDT